MAGKDNFSNLTRTGLVSCLVMMAVLPSQCPVHRALGWCSHWLKLDLKTYCRLLVVSRGDLMHLPQDLLSARGSSRAGEVLPQTSSGGSPGGRWVLGQSLS